MNKGNDKTRDGEGERTRDSVNSISKIKQIRRVHLTSHKKTRDNNKRALKRKKSKGKNVLDFEIT